MKRYIGVTIGPIYDMMNHASTPMALWASSYMFSFLSKNLCQFLVEDGLAEEDIITPFYRADEPLIQRSDGLGLFYDRIIFSAENYDLYRLAPVKDKALKAVAENFNLDFEYLKDYIMIAAAAFEAENPLVESGPILDSFELATPFIASEANNPILSLFLGDKQSKNRELKNIPLLKSLTDFQLKKEDNTIISLLEIAAQGKGYKKFKYFAIVRSDGDNIHTIISTLQSEEEMRAFSKNCLSYCAAIAEKVREFGGVTIYSGGDDLLAILPCENKNALTPFHFVQEANKVFKEHFSVYNVPTSLSFGVVMDYYKSPLYEALEQSSELLFSVVKGGEKNSLAIKLHKSSGQSEGLLIPNENLPDIVDLLTFIRSHEGAREGKDKVVLSALFSIALLEKCFNQAESDAEIVNLFHNFFDGQRQLDNVFLHEKLPALLVKLRREASSVKSLEDDTIQAHNPTQTLCGILRMMKFFFEKGGFEE